MSTPSLEVHAVSEYQWPVGVEIKEFVIFFYKSNYRIYELEIKETSTASSLISL
jgi:hypothetical protein